jgi:thiamine pyrophosphokinase
MSNQSNGDNEEDGPPPAKYLKTSKRDSQSDARSTASVTGDVLSPAKYLGNRKTVQDMREAALVVLNSPLHNYGYVVSLYMHARFHLCADGGANRLSALFEAHNDFMNWRDALQLWPLPDIIHGDLDSLDHEVRTKYESLGVEISQDPDQYSTDFGKAIKKVVERVPDVRNILTLGSIGGRVDQGIGLLGELYREQVIRHPSVRFWLFSESSISVILRPGSTRIETPLRSEAPYKIKRNIGILPLYGPAIITTSGLEWDVQDWPTHMGGQMSTSNHIVADEISVTTDREVLFTVEWAARG